MYNVEPPGAGDQPQVVVVSSNGYTPQHSPDPYAGSPAAANLASSSRIPAAGNSLSSARMSSPQLAYSAASGTNWQTNGAIPPVQFAGTEGPLLVQPQLPVPTRTTSAITQNYSVMPPAPAPLSSSMKAPQKHTGAPAMQASGVPRVGSKRDYSSAPLPDPRPSCPIQYTDAYLGHSRAEDVGTVNSLLEALSLHGLRCSYDREPVGMDGSFVNFVHKQHVAAAIEGADCFVCVCTPGFFRSPACISELEHAHWLGKHVLAVQVGGTTAEAAAASAGVDAGRVAKALGILANEEVVHMRGLAGHEFEQAVQQLAHAIRPTGKSVVEPDANTPIKQLDVMVSYRRKQTEEMKVVCKLLEERGLSYWVDVNAENGILKGVQWGKAIAGAIKGASVFLVLLSRDWLQSTYCIDEFEYAMAQRKRVVVVELEPIPEMDPEPPADATPQQATFYRRQKMCLDDINSWQKIMFPQLMGQTEATLEAARGSPAFMQAAGEMEEALKFDAETARLHTQLTLRADKYKEALGFDVQQRWLNADAVDLKKVPAENRDKAEGFLLSGFALEEAATWLKREGHDLEDRSVLARLGRFFAAIFLCGIFRSVGASGPQKAKSTGHMKPTPEHIILVKHSVRTAQRERRAKATIATIVALLLLAGLITAIVLAVIASNQKTEAEKATDEAKKQEAVAKAQQAEADRQRAIAQAQQAVAEEQRLLAVQQRQEANARATIAAALSAGTADPEAAMLFGLEAISQAASTGSEALALGAQNTLRSLLESSSGEYLSTGLGASAGRRTLLADSTGTTSMAEFVQLNQFSDVQTFTAFSPSGAYSIMLTAGIVSPSTDVSTGTGSLSASTPAEVFQLKIMGHVLNTANELVYAFRDTIAGPANKTSFWPSYIGATRVHIDDNSDVFIHVRRLGREKTLCPEKSPVYYSASCLPRTTGILFVYSSQRSGQRGCMKLDDGSRVTLDVYDVMVGSGFVAVVVGDDRNGWQGWNDLDGTYSPNMYAGYDDGREDGVLAGASKRKRSSVRKPKTMLRLYRGKQTYGDAPPSYRAYMPNTPDACHFHSGTWTTVDLKADDHYSRIDFFDGSSPSRVHFAEYPDPQAFAFARSSCTDSTSTSYFVIAAVTRIIFLPRGLLESTTSTAAAIEAATKTITMDTVCDVISTITHECIRSSHLGRIFQDNLRTARFSDVVPDDPPPGIFRNIITYMMMQFASVSSVSVASSCKYVAGVVQIDRVFEPHDRPSQSAYFLFGVPIADPVGSAATAKRTTFGNLEKGSYSSLTPMIPYKWLDWDGNQVDKVDALAFVQRLNPTFRSEDRNNIYARDPDLIVLDIVKITADDLTVDPKDAKSELGIGAVVLRKGVGAQTEEGICVRNQLVLFTLGSTSTPYSWRRIAELPCSETFHGAPTDMLRKAFAIKLIGAGSGTTFAAIGLPQGKLQFYDIRNPNELLTASTVEVSQLGGNIRSIAPSNDGQYMIVSDDRGSFARVPLQGGSSGFPVQKQLWIYDGPIKPAAEREWMFNSDMLDVYRSFGDYDTFGPSSGFFLSSTGSNAACHFFMAGQMKAVYWDIEATGGQAFFAAMGLTTLANRMHLTQVYKGHHLKTFQHTLDKTKRITSFTELCPECNDVAKGWRFFGVNPVTGSLIGLTGSGGSFLEGDGKGCSYPAQLRTARSWTWRTDDAALPWNAASTAAAGITVSEPFAPFVKTVAEFRCDWFGAKCPGMPQDVRAYLSENKGPTGGVLGAHAMYFPHPSEHVEPMAFSADRSWAACAGVIYALDSNGVPDATKSKSIFEIQPSLREKLLPGVVTVNDVQLPYVALTGVEHAAAFSPDGSLCAFCFSVHAISTEKKRAWKDFFIYAPLIDPKQVGDYATAAPKAEAKGFHTVVIVLVAKNSAGEWATLSHVVPIWWGRDAEARTCRKLSFWPSQGAVVADLRSMLGVFPYDAASGALRPATDSVGFPFTSSFVIPDLVIPNPEDDPNVDPPKMNPDRTYRGTQAGSLQRDQKAIQDGYAVDWADGKFRAVRNTRDGPSYMDASFYVSSDGRTLYRIDSRGAHGFRSLASARAAMGGQPADLAIRTRPYTPRLSRNGRFAAVWTKALAIQVLDLDKGENATEAAFSVPVDARYIDRASVLPAVPIVSDDGRYLAIRYREAAGEFAVRVMDISREELVRRTCSAVSRTFDDEELVGAFGRLTNSTVGSGQRAVCAAFPSGSRKRTYSAPAPRPPAAPRVLVLSYGERELLVAVINVNSGDEVPLAASVTCTGGGATLRGDAVVRYTDAQYMSQLAEGAGYLYTLAPTDIGAEVRFGAVEGVAPGTSYTCEATLSSLAGTSPAGRATGTSRPAGAPAYKLPVAKNM
eukprot:tig00020848_g14611.t1